MLVSLVMAKLPKDVLIHMTDQKNDDDNWTVQLFRDQLVTGKMQISKVLTS